MILLKSFFLCVLFSDEVCEKEIEVDGEPATLTLLDTWDAEVRCKPDTLTCVSQTRAHLHTHHTVNPVPNCVSLCRLTTNGRRSATCRQVMPTCCCTL